MAKTTKAQPIETIAEETRPEEILARFCAAARADAGPLRLDHTHRARQLRSGSDQGLVRQGSGLTFKPNFPMPGGGEYHLFAYSDKGGGGIRQNNPPGMPGSIPYIHVADARAAFEKALREGAEEMFRLTGDGGCHDCDRPGTWRSPDRFLGPVVRRRDCSADDAA